MLMLRLTHIVCKTCGRTIDLYPYGLGDMIVCECGFFIGTSTGDGVEGNYNE